MSLGSLKWTVVIHFPSLAQVRGIGFWNHFPRGLSCKVYNLQVCLSPTVFKNGLNMDDHLYIDATADIPEQVRWARPTFGFLESTTPVRPISHPTIDRMTSAPSSPLASSFDVQVP